MDFLIEYHACIGSIKAKNALEVTNADWYNIYELARIEIQNTGFNDFQIIAIHLSSKYHTI